MSNHHHTSFLSFSCIKFISIGLLSSCATDALESYDSEPKAIEATAVKASNNPYQLLELNDSDWKLQVPIASNSYSCSGKSFNAGVLNISNTSLKTYSHSSYFKAYDSNSVEFTTPGNANTTSCNTTGTRTELRQNTEWNTNGGNTRTLKIKMRITQFSDSKQIGFTQIHTGNDDLFLILAQRITSNSSQFYLRMRGDAVKLGADKLDSNGYVLNSNGDRLKYSMNTAYELKVSSGNNRIKVQIKNSAGSFYSLYDEPTLKDSSTAHFKAGCYILNNADGSGQKGGTAKIRFYTVDYDS
ncbi:polysaccharide lyase family 7 protein [Aquimarina addita]|uniref:Polysaccharide lyase family 7 protein n=1 Tax=Aquimarina addita TaxID=870485 RepID=A0ABP7XH89_9FLAO